VTPFWPINVGSRLRGVEAATAAQARGSIFADATTGQALVPPNRTTAENPVAGQFNWKERRAAASGRLGEMSPPSTGNPAGLRYPAGSAKNVPANA